MLVNRRWFCETQKSRIFEYADASQVPVRGLYGSFEYEYYSLRLEQDYVTHDPLLKTLTRSPTQEETRNIYQVLQQVNAVDSREHRFKRIVTDRIETQNSLMTEALAQNVGDTFYAPAPFLVPAEWLVTDNVLPVAYAHGSKGIISNAFFKPPYGEYLDVAIAWVSAWVNLNEDGGQLLQEDYTSEDGSDYVYADFVTRNFAAWMLPKARFLAAPFYLNRDLPPVITNEGLSKPLAKTEALRLAPVSILQGGGHDYSEFSYIRKTPGTRSASSRNVSNTQSQSHSQGDSGGYTAFDTFGAWNRSDVESNQKTNSQTRRISDVVLDEEIRGYRGLLTYLSDLLLAYREDSPWSQRYLTDAMPTLKSFLPVSVDGAKEEDPAIILYRTIKFMVAYHSNIVEIANLYKEILGYVDAYTAYVFGYEHKLIDFLNTFSLVEKGASEDIFRFYNPAHVRVDEIQACTDSSYLLQKDWTRYVLLKKREGW